MTENKGVTVTKSGGQGVVEEDVEVRVEPRPTQVIPADHVTVGYIPAGEPHPAGGFVEVDADTGAIIKGAAEVDEDRAKWAEEFKKSEDEAAQKAQAEAAKSDKS